MLKCLEQLGPRSEGWFFYVQKQPKCTRGRYFKGPNCVVRSAHSSIGGIVSSGERSSILFDLQKELEVEDPVPTLIDQLPKNIIFGIGVVIPGKQGSFKRSMTEGRLVKQVKTERVIDATNFQFD